MERYFEERVVPRLDAFERRIDKTEHRLHDLSTKFNMAPVFEMDVKGNNPDFVLESVRRAYQLFGGCTNFKIKALLNEVAATDGETNG